MESDNKPGQRWDEPEDDGMGILLQEIFRVKDWSIIHACWKTLMGHALVSAPAPSAEHAAVGNTMILNPGQFTLGGRR